MTGTALQLHHIVAKESSAKIKEALIERGFTAAAVDAWVARMEDSCLNKIPLPTGGGFGVATHNGHPLDSYDDNVLKAVKDAIANPALDTLDKIQNRVYDVMSAVRVMLGTDKVSPSVGNSLDRNVQNKANLALDKINATIAEHRAEFDLWKFEGKALDDLGIVKHANVARASDNVVKVWSHGLDPNKLKSIVSSLKPPTLTGRSARYLQALGFQLERFPTAPQVGKPPGFKSWSDLNLRVGDAGRLLGRVGRVVDKGDVIKTGAIVVAVTLIAQRAEAQEGTKVQDTLVEIGISTIQNFDPTEFLVGAGFQAGQALLPGGLIKRVIQLAFELDDLSDIADLYVLAFPEDENVRKFAEGLDAVAGGVSNAKQAVTNFFNSIWKSNGEPFEPVLGRDENGNVILRCFLAGAEILMADGSSKAIEHIVVGDSVAAFDGDARRGRGPLVGARVTRLFRNSSEEVVLLNGRTRVTSGHEFLTARGEFRLLGELTLGDQLVSEAGEEVTIRSMEQLAGRHETYNFEVEGLHTYIADGYRVHNNSIQVTDDSAPNILIEHPRPDGTYHVWSYDTRTNELVSSFKMTTGERLTRKGVLSEAEETALFSKNGTTLLSDFLDDGIISEDEADWLLRRDAKFDSFELSEDGLAQFNRLREANAIGQKYGAMLGGLINLENPFADIVLDSVLKELGGRLGEAVSLRAFSGEIDGSTYQVFEGFIGDLANTIVDDTQGMVSSYLSKRLIVAIGIEGFAADLIESLANTALTGLIDAAQQIANNLAAPGEAVDPFAGVNVDQLKAQLRSQAETLLTAHLAAEFAGAVGLSGELGAFASKLAEQLINLGVDAALDVVLDDGEGENLGEAFGSILDPAKLTNAFWGAAQNYAMSAINNALLDALGIEGDSVSAQFGRKLAEQVISNATSAVLEGEDLFTSEGINWDTLFAGVGDLAADFLVSSLIKELGIEGPAADFLTDVGTDVVTQIGSNVFSGQDAFEGIDWQNIGWNALELVGSWAVGELTESIIKSEGGAIGAQIGGMVGAYIGSAWGPLGRFVGESIGKIVGAMIGNWIDRSRPVSGSDLAWDASTGKFRVVGSWARDGAPRAQAEAFGEHVVGMLNGVLGASGAKLIDPGAVRLGSYGTYKKDFAYREGNNPGIPVPGLITVRTQDASVMLNYGLFKALSDMTGQLAGGDVYAKRAIAATLANAGGNPNAHDASFYGSFDSQVLLGNIIAGRDLGKYIRESSFINVLVESGPESFFTAAWGVSLARAFELGIHKRFATDWIGGWNLFLDEQADGQIDGRGFSPSNVQHVLRDTGRQIVMFNAGEVVASYGDTVLLGSKARIAGTAGADQIIIAYETWTDAGNTVSGWRVQDTTGLQINGAAPASASYVVSVAAYVDGGAGDDTIIGGDLGNDLLGGEGADTLVGGKLDDWLFGDAGNDRLFAGAANYQFTVGDPAGENAAADVDGGNGNYLDGGAGDDALYGGKGSDWLEGGAGADRLVGGAGGDILHGGAGNDVGANGSAAIFGGAGSDQYIFGYGDQTDVVFDESDPAHGGSNEPDTLHARYVAINIGALKRNWAGGGDYEADGTVRGGEDAITFGEGVSLRNVRMRRSGTEQNPGNDLVIQLMVPGANPNDPYVPTGDELVVKDWYESTRRVEWLRFADGEEFRIGDVASFIVGSGGSDVVIGTYANDFIYAGGGDDTVYAMDGDDFAFGDAGNDFISGDGDEDLILGGSGNDRVFGAAGADTVLGDAGDDVVDGGADSDILAGGRGNDTIRTGSGADIIRYARGDGRDTVYDALVDNYEIVSGPGGYTNGYVLVDGQVVKNGVVYFDGTSWIGEYDYSYATQTFRRHLGAVNGALNAQAGEDAIEFAVGIDIQDLRLRQVGGDLQIAISGGEHDASDFDGIVDRITIKDWYTIGATIEFMAFAATGRHGLSNMNLGGGGEGNDVLAATGWNDWYTGGGGDDVIEGGSGEDILVGNHGGDILRGGADNDVLYGGGGNDILEGGEGADTLLGGEGLDIVSFESASAGVTAYLGRGATGPGSGDTYQSVEGLRGSAFADTLVGDEFDNQIEGGQGDDALAGGGGDDIYIVGANGGSDVIEEGAQTLLDVVASDGTFNATDFEATWVALQEGDPWAYQLTVIHRGSNELVYQSQAFVDFVDFAPMAMPPPLAWPGGERWLNGMGGSGYQIVYRANAAAGAGGDDTLELSDAISLSDIRAERQGGASEHVLVSYRNGGSTLLKNQTGAGRVESIILSDGLAARLDNLRLAGEATGEADELILGGVGADTLSGLGGADVLSGHDGDDVLLGGDGDDILEGGAGADTLDGGANSAATLAGSGDVVRYVGSDAGVVIDLAAATASGGHAAGDVIATLGGVSTIENVTGSHFGDALRGDARRNVLVGLSGNDTLEGGAGDDVLSGDDGNDALYGGDGSDALSGGAGEDTLYGDAGDDILDSGEGIGHLHGGDGNDTLILGAAAAGDAHGGTGADTLIGGAGADLLYGDDGDDNLSGGDGDDQLYGGAGNDAILAGAGVNDAFGGAGDDTYVVAPADGIVRITDADGLNRISFAEIPASSLWFTRSGADLRIRVIGGSADVTLKNYYASGTRVREIQGGSGSLFLGQAEALITAMASVDPSGVPAAMPASLSALLATYWHGSGAAPPIVSDLAVTLAEDGSTSGAVNAADHDENITGYRVLVGAAFGVAAVNASGAWSYTPAADYFGPDRFIIEIEDADGHRVRQVVDLTVTPVNDAPTITPAGPFIVDERTSGPEIGVGQIVAGDVDDVPEALQFHLMTDGGGRFSIGQDGVIQLKNGASLDFEAGSQYTVRVMVTDAAGAPVERDVVIQVRDVNEAPSLNLSVVTASTPETSNVAAAIKVADITIQDDALGANVLILEGADAAAFEIIGSSVYLKAGQALNYEAKSTYDASVRVADPALGYTGSPVAFSLAVSDVNEQPQPPTLSNAATIIIERDRPVSGQALNSLFLGNLAAVDPDGAGTSNATLVFNVGVSDSSRFEIVNGNELWLKAGAALDFEAAPTVSITVTVKDRSGGAGSLSNSQTFTFNVGDAVDYLYGGESADTLNGQQNVDEIRGLGGADTLNGGAGNDRLYGGAGDDTLAGEAGNDQLYGELGADILQGGDGDDVMDGGDGADMLYGGAGADTLTGGVDADTLEGGDGADQLDGGSHIDTLRGGAGDDRLVGGDGDDIMEGGAGADRFLGGAGADTITYASATSGVTLSLAAGTGTGGDAAGDIFEDLPDTVIGSNFADNITGSNLGDVISSLAGDDIIHGGDGSDTLIGGDGNDQLFAEGEGDILQGDAGNDILDGAEGSDTYKLSASSGADTIRDFDAEGNDSDVLGYDGVNPNRLWFRRIGNDLEISVVGTASSARIEGWYTATPPANRKIEFVLAQTEYAVSVDGLVALMASEPQTPTEARRAELFGMTAFVEQWNQLWGTNKPPTISAIDDQTMTEDVGRQIGFTVGDDFTPASGLTVQVETSTDSGFSTSGAGRLSASVSGTGVNRTLTLNPVANASGAVWVRLRVFDGSNVVSEPEVFQITLNPVADAPTVTTSGSFQGSFDHAGQSIDISLSASLVDLDGSETLEEILISNLPAALAFNRGARLGDGRWRFVPTDLAPGLKLVGPVGYSNDLTGGAALSVVAVSREQGGSTATSAPQSISVVIHATPNTPTAGAYNIFNEGNLSNQYVTTISATDPDGPAPGLVVHWNHAELTLANGNEVRFINGLNIDFEYYKANGWAPYLTDVDGDGWKELPFSIQIKASDGERTSGILPLTVYVEDVNEAPTDIYASHALIFEENRAYGDGLVVLGAIDPENNANTFALLDSAGGRFYIQGNVLRVGTAGLNYEAGATQQILVQASDGEKTFNKWFTVTITNVDEAPTFNQMPALSTDENGSGVYRIGPSIRASDYFVDPDLGAFGAPQYWISGGYESIFSINSSGEIFGHAPLNFEGQQSYTITVNAKDSNGAGQTLSQNVTIYVGNVNEAPTGISLSQLSHAENQGYGTTLAVLSATDPEGNANTFSLLDSAGGRFYIDGNLLKVGGAGLNYEAGASTPIRVQVSDGQYTYDTWLPTSITNVNEAPSLGQMPVLPVQENYPAGTYRVGPSFQASDYFSDPDNGGPASYSLGGGGSLFSIDSSTGIITGHQQLNFEAQQSYQVTIYATAADGQVAQQNVTINVTDINDAPNAPYLAGHYLLGATDPDTSGPNATIATYETANGKFTLNWENSDWTTGYYESGTDVAYYPSTNGWVNSSGNIIIRGMYFSGTVWDAQQPWIQYDRFEYGWYEFDVRAIDAGGAASSWVHVSSYAFEAEVAPVVLDLNGDGIQLSGYGSSHVLFDQNNDGEADPTGWISSGDGLLALDRNGDGLIGSGVEISFVQDLAGATTDLEGLSAYDTDANGWLDEADARFGDFVVWRDADQDGVSQAGELFSLIDIGIARIGLDIRASGFDAGAGGNHVTGFADFVRTDGSVGLVGDAKLGYAAHTVTITPVDAPREEGAHPASKFGVDRITEARPQLKGNRRNGMESIADRPETLAAADVSESRTTLYSMERAEELDGPSKALSGQKKSAPYSMERVDELPNASAAANGGADNQSLDPNTNRVARPDAPPVQPSQGKPSGQRPQPQGWQSKFPDLSAQPTAVEDRSEENSERARAAGGQLAAQRKGLRALVDQMLASGPTDASVEAGLDPANRQASALHASLGSDRRRVLGMVDAMAQFSADDGAGDMRDKLLPGERKAKELLTALPDVRHF